MRSITVEEAERAVADEEAAQCSVQKARTCVSRARFL